MIYEQLKDYCDCQEVNKKDVDELVGLISMATCWRDKPCDTFLAEERQEVIDLPDCLDECAVFEFAPFYHPYDIDSFSFTLLEQKGIDENSVPITDYHYSEVEHLFKLQLSDVPSCKCDVCTCGCKPTYKLVVTYTAGYEDLPDCLLPVFCETLQWVNEKNNCDCEGCQPCKEAMADLQYVPDFKDGPSITDRLADYFLKFLTRQYIRELSLISLCEDNSYLKGFIV